MGISVTGTTSAKILGWQVQGQQSIWETRAERVRGGGWGVAVSLDRKPSTVLMASWPK